MNKYKNLAGNTIIFSISKLGSKLISFLLVPLYTACLSQAEYGVAELVTTASELLIPFVTLGLGNAVYRFTFDKNYDDKDVLRSYYFVFAFSCLISLIVGYFVKYANNISDYGIELCLLIILISFNETYGLYLKAKGHTVVFAIDGILYIASLGLANVILLKEFHFGVEGYLSAIIISKIISIVYMFLFGKSTKLLLPIRINWELTKIMLKYSIPLIANSLFWWIMTYLDKYMLSYLSGVEQVGVYTVATKVPGMITTVATIFIDAWTISFIKEYESGNDKGFYRNIMNVFTAVMTILVSLVLLFIIPFMHVYVARLYYNAIPVVPYLLVSSYFMAYASYYGVVFSAVRESKTIMLSSLYGSICNVILNALLIPKIDMIGAAIATAIAYSLVAYYRYYKSLKYMNIHGNIMKSAITYMLIVIQSVFVSMNACPYIFSVAVLVVIILMHRKNMTFVQAFLHNSISKK